MTCQLYYVIGSHSRTALSQQIGEAVRIQRRGGGQGSILTSRPNQTAVISLDSEWRGRRRHRRGSMNLRS